MSPGFHLAADTGTAQATPSAPRHRPRRARRLTPYATSAERQNRRSVNRNPERGVNNLSRPIHQE
ncbi:hypothetical protein Mame01_39750 [Microbispora amethystogenes]|nr:hypothetical protein Mame01_39750 [Microbispora amethystogenes]